MKNLLLLISLISLTACASGIGTGEVKNQKHVQNAIQISSNERDIKYNLGDCTNQFRQGDKKVCEYKFVRIYNPALSYFPIITFFVPKEKYKINYVYLYFDSEGKLVDSKTKFLEGEYTSLPGPVIKS